ncbi:MAG TPA: polysaccharide lyase 6 family protein, partial [Verrucomicrobiae bacterium]
MRIRVLGTKLLGCDGTGRFVLAAFVALLSLAGHAAQVEVSTPAEILNAVALAHPGDTIVMRDGVWPDADILFSANGTAANPITLRAATLGRVHLTGQSRLRLSGNFLVVDGLTFTNGYRTSGDVIAFQESSLSPANNSRLTNCAILYYNPPNPTNDTKWVSIYGFSNRVDNCYFEGKTNVGTTLIVWVSTQSNAPNYHVISRNRFGPRPPLIAASNGGETIRVGTSDVSFNQSRTTVEDNFFDRCNGDAEFISNKSLENVYRRNTFYECEGALTLRHGNGCVVEGNYFFGNR